MTDSELEKLFPRIIPDNEIVGTIAEVANERGERKTSRRLEGIARDLATAGGGASFSPLTSRELSARQAAREHLKEECDRRGLAIVIGAYGRYLRYGEDSESLIELGERMLAEDKETVAIAGGHHFRMALKHGNRRGPPEYFPTRLLAEGRRILAVEEQATTFRPPPPHEDWYPERAEYIRFWSWVEEYSGGEWRKVADSERDCIIEAKPNAEAIRIMRERRRR